MVMAMVVVSSAVYNSVIQVRKKLGFRVGRYYMYCYKERVAAQQRVLVADQKWIMVAVLSLARSTGGVHRWQ